MGGEGADVCKDCALIHKQINARQVAEAEAARIGPRRICVGMQCDRVAYGGSRFCAKCAREIEDAVIEAEGLASRELGAYRMITDYVFSPAALRPYWLVMAALGLVVIACALLNWCGQ